MGMVKMKLVLVVVMCSSCFLMKDDKLGMTRQNYQEDNLRINGYYYLEEKGSNKGLRSVYFFYKDGIVMYEGSHYYKNNMVEIEDVFNFTKSLKTFSGAKTGWGVYEAVDNRIKFEMWWPSNGGPLKTLIRSGKIINDTTFIMTKLYSNYRNKEFNIRDTFHFRHFSPKPDSTNTFID